MIIKKVTHSFRDDWNIYSDPRMTPIQAWRHKWLLTQCKKRGHHIVDCSSTGPDSGDMDHSCVRCGQYWFVPLY